MHPEDPQCFAPEQLPALRAATHDLCWLYERNYKPVSSLKLVGDRYGLVARQRAAVARCACSDSAAERRRQRQLAPSALAGETLGIDGFNVLTTLEVALSGGVVLIGRDGVPRDIAGVHGSYRKVEETRPAIALIVAATGALGLAGCRWLLDAPVSNSGRLRAVLLAEAAAAGLDWTVELAPNPDPILAASSGVVVSADGAILDRARRSFNLVRYCLERAIPNAFVLELASTIEPASAVARGGAGRDRE